VLIKRHFNNIRVHLSVFNIVILVYGYEQDKAIHLITFFSDCIRRAQVKVGLISILTTTLIKILITNKVIMCRQYVLQRYFHLCTTLQFIIYTCI
jgi:hypothetical protein